MTSHLLRRLIPQTSHHYKNAQRMFTENYPELNFETKPPHFPVMVGEVIEHLNLKEGNVFLDMTFGAGGHSTALLERIPDLKVIALDRDPLCQTYAKELERMYPGQVIPLEGKFSDLPLLLKDTEFTQNSFDGILFDLGCSSMQFDCPERGFSIKNDGPLDMRMDGDRVPGQLTAAQVINYASELTLVHIFKKYGEEKKARKIANAIMTARNNCQGINTTQNLVDVIETACTDFRTDKLGRKTSVATKVFQGLRIFVNNEINELNYGIVLAGRYLKPGGRAVVISFHSLEDTVVKRHFRNHIVDNCNNPLQLIYRNACKNFEPHEMKAFEKKIWERINKKVIVPTEEEVSLNPRSRSAKLRAAFKIIGE